MMHPMENKKKPTTKLSRSVTSLARLSDPSGSLQAIDLFVESIVCGRSSTRAMIIAGPVGSGKRQVALAAAAEFGTHVTEIEPNSLVSRDELVALLDSVGSDGVLVIHNFDELPNKAQQELCLLITTGHALERPNPYLHESAKGHLATELEQPAMVIATTNMLQCMPHPMIQALPCFTLRRYRESIRSSLQGRLAASRATCDADSFDALVDLIYLSPADRFETVATVLTSQAARCAGGAVDAPTGARVVGMCWAAMPTQEIVSALQALALEQGVVDPDWKALAEELGLPAALRAEVARAAEQDDGPRSGRDRGPSGAVRRPVLPPNPDGGWWPE
jgi:hypothetical protein